MPDMKAPPHNYDAENAVLGGIMVKNSAIHDVDMILDGSDFYSASGRLIYQAMWSMALQSKPIDLITLSDFLDDSGDLDRVGGLDALAELQEASYSAHNIEAYAQIIKDTATERRLLAASHEIGDIVYRSGGDVAQKVEAAQKAVFDIQLMGDDEPVIADTILKDVINEIDRRSQNGGGIHGLKTGISDFDRMTGGLQPEQLVLIAGRPGQGKTVVAMNIAENVALAGGLVIVFNLEMSRTELMTRSIASLGRAKYEALRDGKLDAVQCDALTAGVVKLKGKKLYIDDSQGLTSANVASRARRISNRQGVSPALVVVDYLQLLNDDDKHGPVERISRISRNLKRTAKELKCPVIAVSQLNRGVESRPNKRPMMSDLRESGALEQDADIIGMIYRDQYYNEHSEWENVAELGIKKHRGGKTGTIYLVSRLEMMRFDDIAPGFVPPDTGKPSSKGGMSY